MQTTNLYKKTDYYYCFDLVNFEIFDFIGSKTYSMVKVYIFTTEDTGVFTEKHGDLPV